MTRLIDADKAERDIEELRKSDWFNAPYLSKERKIGLSEAFDMIQSVCIKHAPPVDAIPIEFIKSEIARMKEGLNPHHPECAIYAEDLGILIEEWEGSKKEYETD